MTNKESSEKEDTPPYFHKGAECELVVGNFSISLKSTRGENLEDIMQSAVAVYEHVLRIARSEPDPGVR